MTESTHKARDGWLEGRPVEAPVDAVLVMEDRAQVTRRTRVSLEGGNHHLGVASVSPLVADRTLRCRVCDGQGAPVDDEQVRVQALQVKRHYLIEPARPAREQELTGAIREIEDAYLAAYDQDQARLHQLQLARHAVSRQGAYIGDRLVVGPFDPAWTEGLDKLFERRAGLEHEVLTGRREQEERLRRLERLHEEREVALRPRVVYQAGFEVHLRVAAPGDYLLAFEYQIPCALWRPEYTAELVEQEEGPQVTWESAGMVWQATGEDWQDVELELSTARPTLGAEMPLLDDDVLVAREKTDQEKKIIEVTSRDEVIARTTDLPGEVPGDTPPGLEDGGEARTYRVPERVRVPADGRPHRLVFEQWSAPAEVGMVCIPENASFVFLRSMQTNPSAMPLLAGPVYLIRQGGFLGRSKVGFIAAGEKFTLSWGSEDGLVVLRKVTRDIKETRLRKHKSYTYETEVYLANHTGVERKLEVVERVPVAEIEQVEVAIQEEETTTGWKRDDQGHVRWDVKLAPGRETTLRLGYRIGMPHNVRWAG